MGKCAVLFCKNHSGQSKNVTYHSFPVDLLRKRKWVESVRREITWIPTKHSRICSIHFEEECFNTNSLKQKKLHKDSIPTLNLPVFSHDIDVSDNELKVTSSEGTYDKPSTLVNQPVEAISDTPRIRRLMKKLHEKDRKIKRLQYRNRNLSKKVASLEEMLKNKK